MREDELRARLRATFVEELEDAVSALRHGLEAFAGSPPAGLDSLLRTTHSLKGAARSARVDLVEHVCHLMEELLLGLKRGVDGAQRSRLVELLLSTTDALSDTPELLARQVDLGPSRLAMLLPHLGDAAMGLKTQGEEAAPSLPRSPATPSEPPSETPADRPRDEPASPAAEDPQPVPGDALRRWRPAPADPATPPAEVPPPTIRREEAFEALAAELASSAGDLAQSSGKKVRLVVDGSPERIGDRLARRLRDPLRHLVRNAVDHGIESPDERSAAGKERRGTIRLAVEPDGFGVRVTVSDDGRGIDLALLIEAAERRGLAVPTGTRAIAQMVFEPGLTTRRTADERAGRGIGLDAVRTAIESLGGSASVDSEPGRGSSFALRLPSLLEPLRALVLSVAGQRLGLAAESVEQILEVRSGQAHSSAGRVGIEIDGRPAPLLRLLDLLGSAEPARPRLPAIEAELEAGARPAIVLRRGDQRVALLVDDLSEARRLPQAPLAARLKLPMIEGAVVLDATTIVFLLSPAALFEAALSSTPGETAP